MISLPPRDEEVDCHGQDAEVSDKVGKPDAVNAENQRQE